MGDRGGPLHKVGVLPGDGPDDGLGEERGPTGEVVVNQGGVHTGLAGDSTQGCLIAVTGEGCASGGEDRLAGVRGPGRASSAWGHAAGSVRSEGSSADIGLIMTPLRACREPQAVPDGADAAAPEA